MKCPFNEIIYFFFYKIMRECGVKRGEIISRQTKNTKLSGFQSYIPHKTFEDLNHLYYEVRYL